MDSLEKKCIKKTNSQQFDMLVNLMEKNKELAKCLPVFGSSKISSAEEWNDIARQINSYGPPERTGSEWKKIWADLKSRTKKKIGENNKHMCATGGGPYRAYTLSDLEQSVDKILHLSAAANPNGKVFGLPKSRKEKESSPNSVNKLLESNLTDVITTDGNLCTEPQNFELSEKSIELPNNQPDKVVPSTPSPTVLKNDKVIHTPQYQLLGKRKFDNSDEQVKLLRKQVESQAKIQETMENQTKALKELAEVATTTAEAIITIADSSQVIANALQDILKYLKQ